MRATISVAESAPFGKTSHALWQRMLDVNLTGTFLCMQAALPDMLAARQGRIVNIASTAGQRGYAYVAAYVAAKHGVVGLTRSLALELAPKGITVNAVCPGYTETEILRESIANVMAKTGRSEAEARAEFARGNPQGRIVQPQEVADAVQWLCSDAAGAITGALLIAFMYISRMGYTSWMGRFAETRTSGSQFLGATQSMACSGSRLQSTTRREADASQARQERVAATVRVTASAPISQATC